MYFPLTSRPRLLLPSSFPHPLPRPLLFLLQEVHWTDLQERASIRVRVHAYMAAGESRERARERVREENDMALRAAEDLL